MSDLAGAAVGGIFDLIGGHQNRQAQERANEQNAQLQREFAQNGLRWKMEDAQRAGIHPLYAMGAPSISASPSYVGDTSTGNALSNMGQNLTRAITSTKTAEEKEAMRLQLAFAKAQLDGEVLENQRKLIELNRIQKGPGFPSNDAGNFMPGQPDAGRVVVKPATRTASAPGRPAQEAGWRPDVSYARTDTGLTPVIPESLSESMEDDIIGKIGWRIRNQVAPTFDQETSKPAKSQLPPGYDDWIYYPHKQQWQPVKYRKVKPTRLTPTSKTDLPWR